MIQSPEIMYYWQYGPQHHLAVRTCIPSDYLHFKNDASFCPMRLSEFTVTEKCISSVIFFCTDSTHYASHTVMQWHFVYNSGIIWQPC